MTHVTTTVTKMRLFGNHSQVYYDNCHNMLSAEFQSGVLLFTELLSWSLTKPQIMTLFYLARAVSVMYRQKLRNSGISSKAINHPFGKTLLVLADFSRGTLIHKPDKQTMFTGLSVNLLKFRIPCRLYNIQAMTYEKSPQQM